jgi:hypothetical protein
MTDLTPKERMAIQRVKMCEQDAAQRACNFQEVNQGLTPELARWAASCSHIFTRWMAMRSLGVRSVIGLVLERTGCLGSARAPRGEHEGDAE